MTAALAYLRSPPPPWLAWCAALETRLQRLGRRSFALLATALALGLSVFFWSPNFIWLLKNNPGSTEWARARSVQLQARTPFTANATLEPAMRWRVLPAVVLHLAGSHTAAIVALPWLGLTLLLFLTAGWLDQWTGDRVAVLLATVLLGGSGAVITVTNYLGINDAWFLVALVFVTFSSSPRTLLLAGLAGPWIDERYILALPLAWFARALFAPGDRGLPALLAAAAGPLLFLGLRALAVLCFRDATSVDHVAHHLAQLRVYLPHGPLGWLMGFRSGWLLLLLGCVYGWRRDRTLAWLLAGSAAAGMVAITCVAADLTRSTNLLIPLFCASVIGVHRQLGAERSRWLLGLLAGINVLVPMSWVTYVHHHWLWPMPIEFWRLIR